MRDGSDLPITVLNGKPGYINFLDALNSVSYTHLVQMPSGIPVATVAIDGAANAALLAIQILAVENKDLAAKLDARRAADAEKVLAKDASIEEKLRQ